MSKLWRVFTPKKSFPCSSKRYLNSLGSLSTVAVSMLRIVFSPLRHINRRLSTTAVTKNLPRYETLELKNPRAGIFHVEINRPDKANALNNTCWREIKECFHHLDEDENCRAAILSGVGKLFSGGIDIAELMKISNIINGPMDVARKSKKLWTVIKQHQNCTKPVIAAVHGACIGAAVDLICAADIRYCSTDAWFQIKEVDMGLAADVGTLQRFPKLIGSESLARELVFTSRKLTSEEALKCGFVSAVFDDYQNLIGSAIKLAGEISSKSPVAVQGSKIHLVYSRDHSVQEGLDFMATWNMSMLQTEDIPKCISSTPEAPGSFENF